MLKTNHLSLNIEGVNLKRLLKTFHKNKIDIYNINFISHKNMQITIKAKDYNKTKNLLIDYRFNILKRYGLSFLKNYAIIHIGLVIGILFFFGIVFLNNNYLSKIYITGNERISNEQIKTFLKENNIKSKSFFLNVNIDEIENNLQNNFDDISMVSVIKKGTNLIINIKEKILIEDVVSRVDITNKVNGQIVELKVIQGTSDYKIGDSIKAGDIIVNGYTNNDGKLVDCKAIANYKLAVWYSSSYYFYDKETVVERTGQKICNTYYEIYNKKLKMKTKENNFEKFEKETKTSYIFNNFIFPLKIYSENYYEIKENVIKNDFSLQKDAIIEKTTLEAKAKLPPNTEIQDITTEIKDIKGGKIITTYVKTIQSFN